MLQPQTILRLLSEAVFVLLGLLLVQVALTGQGTPERKSALWYGAAALVIYFGARSFAKAGRYVSRREHLVRGGSLVLLGTLMLAMAWAPVGMVPGLLLGVAGVLILRGLATAILVLRKNQR